jgi:hypothetical protein
MSSSGLWRCVYPALTEVSEERIASIFSVENPRVGTSISMWLQTEPPVGNIQLYNNRDRGSVGHMGNQQSGEG